MVISTDPVAGSAEQASLQVVLSGIDSSASYELRRRKAGGHGIRSLGWSHLSVQLKSETAAAAVPCSRPASSPWLRLPRNQLVAVEARMHPSDVNSQTARGIRFHLGLSTGSGRYLSPVLLNPIPADDA